MSSDVSCFSLVPYTHTNKYLIPLYLVTRNIYKIDPKNTISKIKVYGLRDKAVFDSFWKIFIFLHVRENTSYNILIIGVVNNTFSNIGSSVIINQYTKSDDIYRGAGL